MNKETLRQEALALRAAITQATYERDSTLIRQQLFTYCTERQVKRLAIYAPIRGEVNLLPTEDELRTLDVQLCLPVINAQDHVRFCTWDGRKALHPGKYGILCPSNTVSVIPDVIALPMLAYDDTGTRLGYGGGYYDALLAKDDYSNCFRLGIAFDCQHAEHLPVEPHDVRLQAVLTEKGLKNFS